MNFASFPWAELVSGVRFLLGVQLILVAAAHLSLRWKRTSFLLGLLCLLLGLWFFKVVFQDYWEENLLLFILIGPGKPIFAGALLLFYYRLYGGADLERRYVLRMLIPPTVYYVLLLAARFFFAEDLPPDYAAYLSYVFTGGVLLIYWYYFVLTRREIRERLRRRLIRRAYHKVRFLFYSIYFFMLQVPLWDFVLHVLNTPILPPDLQQILISRYAVGLRYWIDYVVYGYLHLLGLVLFLYALSELAILKTVLLPENTLVDTAALRNREKMEELLERHLVGEQLFKNAELTLDNCARAIGVSKRELIAYFSLREDGTFKDVVNRLRVEEFKRLVQTEAYRHYDLVGLARQSGFNAKSTFFRVFKSLEGITPNQYRQHWERANTATPRPESSPDERRRK